MIGVRIGVPGSDIDACPAVVFYDSVLGLFGACYCHGAEDACCGEPDGVGRFDADSILDQDYACCLWGNEALKEFGVIV